MRVTLRHLVGAVAEKRLDRIEVDALHDQVRRECMAQIVKAEIRDAGIAHRFRKFVVKVRAMQHRLSISGEHLESRSGCLVEWDFSFLPAFGFGQRQYAVGQVHVLPT